MGLETADDPFPKLQRSYLLKTRGPVVLVHVIENRPVAAYLIIDNSSTIDSICECPCLVLSVLVLRSANKNETPHRVVNVQKSFDYGDG